MSQVDDVVVPLLSARIFTGLAPAQLKALALEAEVVTFRRGETIIKAYQEGDGAFLIGSGAVIEEPDAGEGEPSQEFGSGTMIGEMAMLVETLHSATIIARTPVRALKFRRESLYALMAKDESLSGHFVDKMRERLVETANKLRDVERTFGEPAPRLADRRVLS
jgi:CRP-like cAMP-binding protein